MGLLAASQKAWWWLWIFEINECRTWHLVRFYKVEYVWPQTWPAWKHALFICLISPNLMSWYGLCFQASISRQHSSIWTMCLTSRSYMKQQNTPKYPYLSLQSHLLVYVSSRTLQSQLRTSAMRAYKECFFAVNVWKLVLL